VKNITVSIEDEVYRLARVKAAEQGSSVSALVKSFLIQLTSEKDAEFQRLKAEERELRASLRARGSRFRAADRLSRDELHERDALR
jgi:hypothetical protein